MQNIASAARVLTPPFTHETALAEAQRLEDLWNTRDPERVALACAPDSEWRNRLEFLRGPREIAAFLRSKWGTELDYRIRRRLWGFHGNRMAMAFESEWHDAPGQWFRSYGTELWEFNDGGLVRRRIASINDAPIHASERRIA